MCTIVRYYVTSVSKMMASGYHYREVANLMEAVKQLMNHFEKYTNIPKVAEIKSRVVTIQKDLKAHVHAVFQEIGQVCGLPYSVPVHTRLTSPCADGGDSSGCRCHGRRSPG